MVVDNNFDLQQDLQPELIAGERLLWTGKPKTGIVFRMSDAAFIPFSILWFGFAIFWEFGASQSGGAFFMIWGIPFIVMGFYMTVGRFFYDAWLRKNTIYGITNNRIIIKDGVFNTTVNSFNINTLPNLGLDEKKDGSGSITLDESTGNFSGIRIRNLPQQKPNPQIEFIPNVRSVYNLILQQQKK